MIGNYIHRVIVTEGSLFSREYGMGFSLSSLAPTSPLRFAQRDSPLSIDALKLFK